MKNIHICFHTWLFSSASGASAQLPAQKSLHEGNAEGVPQIHHHHHEKTEKQVRTGQPLLWQHLCNWVGVRRTTTPTSTDDAAQPLTSGDMASFTPSRPRCLNIGTFHNGRCHSQRAVRYRNNQLPQPSKFTPCNGQWVPSFRMEELFPQAAQTHLPGLAVIRGIF